MENITSKFQNLYRLPWSLPDNPISWLEPTSVCNLACEGCYRGNEPDSHKTLSEIDREVQIFKKLRNTDGISIAGGEPLLHPKIEEIVQLISETGLKPIINTNGIALTKELLKSLKKAGVCGFTIHIDSKQGRPGWKDKNELELNELRLKYAEMLAEEGGIFCAFNSTVYEDTLPYANGMIEWAGKHIDIVQLMVFILYRAAIPDLSFDWYIGGEKIALDCLKYAGRDGEKIDLKSTELLSVIQEKFPEFTPCAFLNGTEKPDSYKWLLTARMGFRDRILGYPGPKHMEIIQSIHHLVKGQYLAYCKPLYSQMGRSMLLFSFLDPRIRTIAVRYLKSLFTKPTRLFKKIYYQSIMIIQPVDFLPSGAQNMCDSCPDMTVWKDQLVWSCRLEELKTFGCWVRSIPKSMKSEVVEPKNQSIGMKRA